MNLRFIYIIYSKFILKWYYKIFIIDYCWKLIAINSVIDDSWGNFAAKMSFDFLSF